MAEIIRMEDKQEFALHLRYIFGLNLFDYNDVACPIEQRPDVLFLRHLTTQLPCSAQVGAMALKYRMEAPEAMFGPPDGETPYLTTRIGYYDGFYDMKDGIAFESLVEGRLVYGEKQYGDCFFPQVTPAFWQALLREEGDLEQLLWASGFAFYVAPTQDAGEKMGRLLRAPFVSEGEWLQAVTKLYPVVLTVGHDGQYFHLYTQDAAHFALLEPSLSNAVSAVEASDWFQVNRDRLAWDELNGCLVLPE